MPSPLQRLYKTKFTLLAVVSTVVGVALIFVAHWASRATAGAWLRSWPVDDVGLGLFTTGLFGVLFQYVGQQDAEEASLERIRAVIADDFAARPDGLVALVSSESRDRIIANCLGIQLDDRILADSLLADLREQFDRTEERRFDLSVSVALARWDHGPASGKGSMFVATIRWEYRVVPTNPIMRFACVSDLDEFRELHQDASVTAVHYFEPIGKLTGESEQVFQLLQVAVDGRQLPARRAQRAGSQTYTVNLGADVVREHQEVTISYVYRVLVQRHGHLLHLDISKPTKGLKVQFAYGNCGIRYVNVLDYIASARQPRLTRLPASVPTPSIELGFDGWVLPKAGVGFVWVLEDEFVAPRSVAAPVASQSNRRIKP